MIVSSRYEFVCRRYGATFIYVKAIQMIKIYLINDKKSNKWSSICYKIKEICIIITIIISNI